MQVQIEPLSSEVQYFFDSSVESGEMSALTAAVLQLRGDRKIVVDLMNGVPHDCAPDEVVQSRHFTGQVSDRLTAYASDVLKEFTPCEQVALRAYAIPQALYDCGSTAEILAGWNFEDSTTGGALRPWKPGCAKGERLVVPSKRLSRRLTAPRAIRHYIKKETPDTLARLRRINKTLCADPFPTSLPEHSEVAELLSQLRMLWSRTQSYASVTSSTSYYTNTATYMLSNSTTSITTSATPLTLAPIQQMQFRLSDDYNRLVGADEVRSIYAAMVDQLRVRYHAEGDTKEYKQRLPEVDRDVARKSLELARQVVGDDIVRQFLRGDSVDIVGRNVIFRLKKSAVVDRLGHGVVTTHLHDLNGTKLCGLCVYFQDMPPLDQLAAFALYVESGEEATILDKGNKFSLTPEGYVFFGQESATRLVNGGGIRTLQAKLREDYEKATFSIYFDVVKQAAFGKYTRRISDLLSTEKNINVASRHLELAA